MANRTIEYRTDFRTVASAWKQMVAGAYAGRPCIRHVTAAQAGSWRGATDGSSFYGVSAATMTEYVEHGFLMPGMDVKRGASMRPRRKLRRHEEEGELQVDLALSGDDKPYLNSTKRKRTPGINLDVELAVLADTPASVLSDYAKWIARLIYGLEDRGYRMNVTVVSRCRNLAGGVNADTYVKVANANRKSDFKTWSAMLSPGGFRHLIFAARLLNAQHNGVIPSGMGGSYGPEWGMDWDAKTRTLTIKCAASSHRFPTEQMDRDLAAVTF